MSETAGVSATIGPSDMSRVMCQVARTNMAVCKENGHTMGKSGIIFLGANGVGKTHASREAVDVLAKEVYGMDTVVDYHESGRHADLSKGEFGLIMFNPSTWDEWDVTMPELSEGRYKKILLELFPRDPNWKGSILIDEFAKNYNLFKCWSQMTNEGQLDDWLVPEHALIVLMGNGEGHNSSSHSITDDLTSRTERYTVTNDSTGFLEYEGHSLHPIIIACCKYFGDDFAFTQTREQEQNPGEPFATARTLKGLSNRMIHSGMTIEDPIAYATVIGRIGLIAGQTLWQVWQTAEDWGDLDDLIDNPDTPENRDKIAEMRDADREGLHAIRVISMMIALSQRLAHDHTQFDKFAVFVRNFGAEQRVAFYYLAQKANPKVREEAEFAKIIIDNKELFF